MRYFCGVDIGASAVKLVIIDEQRRMLARAVGRSGVDYGQSANRCLAEALSAAKLESQQLHRFRVHGLRSKQRPLGGRIDDRDCLPCQRSLLAFSSAHDGG